MKKTAADKKMSKVMKEYKAGAKMKKMTGKGMLIIPVAVKASKKAFKPCAGCKSPAKCTKAGMCMKKAMK